VAFFEGKQAHFFLPLARTKREKVAHALEAIYHALYSPEAGHGIHFDRRTLTLTVEHAMAQAPDEIQTVMTGDLADVGELTPAACVNLLEDNGWLESYRDTTAVQLFYRLTPTGKAFARIFWERNHPSAATQNRHMRSCDALLRTFLDSVDAADLLDAQAASEKVLEDMTAEIEQLRIRVRMALQEARQKQIALNEFEKFMRERFRKEIEPKLMADSPMRLKGTILESLDRIRTASQPRLRRMQESLCSVMTLPSEEAHHQILVRVDRIEQNVRYAVERCVPELIGIVSRYVDRMVSLLRQSATSRSGQKDLLQELLGELRLLEEDVRDRRLESIEEFFVPIRVRLMDPADLKVREARPAPVAEDAPLTIERDPDSIVQARIKKRMEEVLTISAREVHEHLRSLSAARGGRVRLSEILIEDSRDLTIALNAPTMMRSLAKTHPIEVRPVAGLAENLHFSTQDVEFVLQPEEDTL
jgi:hypothetical protein